MRQYSQPLQSRIHLADDSRMDHPLKAEKGNEERDREGSGEITVISIVAQSDCG